MARFSSWMAQRHLELADLDGDLIDEYVRSEQERIGSRTPAAFQYLPVARRYFVAAGVIRPAASASRSRGGVPRLLAGPLAGVIPELVTWLRLQGCATGTVKSVAETAARLSAWMHASALTAGDVSHELLERFVVAQNTGQARHPSSARRIVTVRKYLIACGVLGEIASVPAHPATPVTAELDAWGAWLRIERGIGAATVADRQRWAGPFLAGLLTADGRIDWAQADCAGVNRYVASRGTGYSLSSRRHLVTAIRSLLRWAFATARTAYGRGAARTVLPARAASRAAATTGPGDHSRRRRYRPDGHPGPGRGDDDLPARVTRRRGRRADAGRHRLGRRPAERGGQARAQADVAASGRCRRGAGGLPAGAPGLRHQPGSVPAGPSPMGRAEPAGDLGIVARLAARAGLGTVHVHRLRHAVATQVVAAGG